MSMAATGLRLLTVVVLCLLAAPADAQSPVRRWGPFAGDPCCGVPPEKLVHLDAQSACEAGIDLAAWNGGCKMAHGVYSAGGRNPPNAVSACLVKTTCLCGDCLVG